MPADANRAFEPGPHRCLPPARLPRSQTAGPRPAGASTVQPPPARRIPSVATAALSSRRARHPAEPVRTMCKCDVENSSSGQEPLDVQVRIARGPDRDRLSDRPAGRDQCATAAWLGFRSSRRPARADPRRSLPPCPDQRAVRLLIDGVERVLDPTWHTTFAGRRMNAHHPGMLDTARRLVLAGESVGAGLHAI
jgi:hypothetical protein